MVSGIRSRPFSSFMRGGGAYVLRGAKRCPQRSGPPFRRGPGRAGGDGQESVGEHREGDVPVPGAVLADLVVIEPGLVLSLGEAVLHRPPGAGHGDQLGHGGAGRGEAAEERQLQPALLARVQGPADKQLMARGGSADQRPVIQPGPLGPVGAGQPLPPARRAPGPPGRPRGTCLPGR